MNDAVNDDLVSAALSGDIQGIDLALDAMANIHYKNDKALIKAIENGQNNAAIHLLKRGANVNAECDSADYVGGITPVSCAALHGNLELVEELIKRGADIGWDKDCAYRLAAENGHADTVDTLLKHGADIHAQDDYALIRAAEYGHSQVLYTLIVKHDFKLSDKTKEHLQEHGQYEPFKIIEKNELRKRLEAKSSNLNRPKEKKQSYTLKI